ncbi:MAG: CRISPR-associated endonuclease Cas6 [Bacteroidota bacterium]
MTPISTLYTQFSLPLRPGQIPAFRGAVAEAAGWEQDLFHNHARTEVVPAPQPVAEGPSTEPEEAPPVTLKDQFVYRYPRIQYRVRDGKAVIWAIGEGVPALRRWLMEKEDQILIGGRKRPLLIEQLREGSHQLRLLPKKRLYRLMDYQPFNGENYREWQQAEHLIARIQLIERILTGNLLNIAKVAGVFVEERIEAQLMNLRDTKTVRTHGTQRLAFNLIFQTNLDLPPSVALGRAVSHGFGVCERVAGS